MKAAFGWMGGGECQKSRAAAYQIRMKEREPRELLREYARGRSEEAFAELVRRQGPVVYGSALRILRNPALAEDVTQKVFIALASNAGRLQERESIRGWLHKTTHNFAVMAVRTEERRRAREKGAAAADAPEENDARPEPLAGALDEALAGLSEADREVLLLRYFEGKSGREAAEAVGVSEEALHKRASRALERLREKLRKLGAPVSGGALAASLPAHGAAAPGWREAAVLRISAKACTEGGASVPGPAAALFGPLQGKPMIAAVLAVLCASLGTSGFLAGRAAAERHHALAAWQPVVAGAEEAVSDGRGAAVAPDPEPEFAPGAADRSVSEIMAGAATYFRARDSDPDAWAKGRVALGALRPSEWKEALAEWERYQGEAAVFQGMAPTILGLWAAAEPEKAARYAVETLAENSRGLAFEQIFKSWSGRDPAGAWAFFLEQSEKAEPPLPHLSWMWMPKYIFAEWAVADAEGAFRRYAELGFAEEKMAMWGIVEAALEPGARAGILEQLEHLPDERQRERLALKLALVWAQHEPAAAGAWASGVRLENPAARVGIIAKLMGQWWRLDPHGAARWFLTSAPEEARKQLMPIFKEQAGGGL